MQGHLRVLCCFWKDQQPVLSDLSPVSTPSLPSWYLLSTFIIQRPFIYSYCFVRTNDAYFCLDLFIKFQSRFRFHSVLLHSSSLPLLAYSLTWSVTNPLFLCAHFAGRERERGLATEPVCSAALMDAWYEAYPALSFSFISVMPSLDTSLLKTRIPITMLTWRRENTKVNGHAQDKTLSLIKK